MAKHFVFESGHQQEINRNEMFFTRNRSPSFQENTAGCEDRGFDSERENFYLKQKVKELEECSLKSNEDFLNREIIRMKEFQEKEQKIFSEYSHLERKYTKLKRNQESVMNENLFLQKQLKESLNSHKKDDYLTETKDIEFFELISKYRALEKELESIQRLSKDKVSKYKAKVHMLKNKFDLALQEKNEIIQELESTVMDLKRKFSSRSPMKMIKTPRRTSVNHLQEITNTINALEKSQADYKQKYKNLQKSKAASFKEINNLYDILKDNEKRLKQAKKMQENIFKSN